MNFTELDIPLHSVLLFKDASTQVTVCGPKTVRFHGEECSLTAATRKVLGYPDNYPLQPSPYWTFHGKTIKEIYENCYAEVDEE